MGVFGSILIVDATPTSAGALSAVAAQGAPIDRLVATTNSQPVSVALSVSNGLDQPRTEEPVTTGVPLPRGQLKDASALWIEDAASGVAVPAQFTVMSRWNGTPDDETKDIKWVQVDMQSSVAANGSSAYVLRSEGGSNAALTTPVMVAETSDNLSVDTGPLQFAVSTGEFGALFDGIWLDSDGDGVHETEVQAPGSGGGIVLTRTDGTVFRSTSDFGAAHSVEVELAGPMHTVIKVEGQHRTKADNGLCISDYRGCIRDQLDYLDYTVRIHAYAGTSYVRVFYSLTNPENFLQNAYNSGGERLFQEWDGLSLNLALSTGTQPVGYTIGAESPDGHEYPGNKSANPGAGPELITGSLGSSSVVELYQDSSGVENWQDSPDGYWGTSFEGFRTYQDDQQQTSGLQAAGWTTVATDNWSAGVGVRHFWQNFPKGLRIGNGEVGVDLWPARSRDDHTFAGGRQKTHELVIGAWPTGVAAGDINNVMTATLEPMHALASNTHYADTMALGLIAFESDGSDPRFSFYEATSRAMADSPGTDVWAERFDEDLYGWRNWGDAYRGGSKNFGRYFGNNEFDLTNVNLLNYLRSGDHNRQMFDIAESAARQLYDIDIYHADGDAIAYSHGVHQHDASGVVDHSRAPNPSHYWIRGLLNYYLLTGDRFALDGAVETGIWLDNMVDDQTGELIYNGQSRSQAWSVLALTELWEATGEQRYLDTAGALAKAEIIDDQGRAGATYPCSNLDWEGDAGVLDKTNVSVWANGYVAEALGRYALARRFAGSADAPAEAALAVLLDEIEACGWATQENGKFVPADTRRDDEIYGVRYEQAVLDRIYIDGDYTISFAINQVLTDGYAYGYIFSGDQNDLTMADATWTWTMGPNKRPGVPNIVPGYTATTTSAKQAAFRQRFGQAYLWLSQNLDNGPTPTPRAEVPTATPTPGAPTTAPTSAPEVPTPTPEVQEPTLPSCVDPASHSYSIDFESEGSTQQFVSTNSANVPLRMATDSGHVMAVNSNNSSQHHLFNDGSQKVTAQSEVTMATDIDLAYFGSTRYGARGSSHGLVLKTLPSTGSQGVPNAYVATVFPTESGITLRLGAVADGRSGTQMYQFLNPSDGHSPAGDHTLFAQAFTAENTRVELGRWRLAATLTTQDGRVGIEASLTNPLGISETQTWFDDGDAAHSGNGNVGVVSSGVWSIPSRYDNIDISLGG